MRQGSAMIIVALSYLVVSTSEVDPFADLAHGLMSDHTRLKAERDAKREAFKQAGEALKEARTIVADLEIQLRDAKELLRRNETAYEKAKADKAAAEKTVLTSLTSFVDNIKQTADGKLGQLRESLGGSSTSSFSTVQPARDAKVVLWEERNFKGKSLKLTCCGKIELAASLNDAGFRTVRSITVPEGIRAILHGSQTAGRIHDIPATSFEAYGDLSELDGLIRDYRQSCCAYIDLRAGVQHHEDSSVVIYDEENFSGKSAAYLQGDYGAPSLKNVGSVRVPAGYRVTIRAAAIGDADHFGRNILGILRRDTRAFPVDETSSASVNQGRQPQLPVKSISVRSIDQADLHGLWVYFESGFAGRPQFFQSGEHYLYPDSWRPIKSVQPTNRTYARLFASGGLKTIRSDVHDLDANLSRPYTLEVAAICDPLDMCGQHGRCVQPQRCECSGSFQGEFCHLQIPDETSSILCGHNVVAVGESLQCRLLLRRDNTECNATSLFIRVDLTSESSVVANLYGLSVIKGERAWGHVTKEADVFPFDVVFNASGVFKSPFILSVFNKAQEGAFVPQLEVLARCDEPGTSAMVACGDADVPPSCGPKSCVLTLVGTSTAVPLRCPLRSLKLFLKGSPADWSQSSGPLVELPLSSNAAVAQQFCFNIETSRAPLSQEKNAVHLIVEVRHGDANDVPALEISTILEAAQLKGGSRSRATSSDEVKSAVALGQSLLRRGDIAGALESLSICHRDGFCSKFRSRLLIRLSFFEAAERSATEAERRQIDTARQAAARGAEAVARGDHEAAVAAYGAALEIAPMSAQYRLARAEAALQIGDFDAALEDARHARKIGSQNLHGQNGIRSEELLGILGHALLGIGLSSAALQNFIGCTRLPADEVDVEKFRKLASDTRDLERDATGLETAFRAEAWHAAVEKAEELLLKHNASWPGFQHSIWGLQVAVVSCISLSAVNESNASVQKHCVAVVEAPSRMLARLDSSNVVRCHVVLAEALQRDGLLRDASQWADVAGEIVESSEVLEWLSGEVRLLRERLRRARNRQTGAESLKAHSGSSNNASKIKKKIEDHYEVLGLGKNASVQEIKSAYRRLALKYHPDKNPDPDAVQMFLDIQQAYQVLSDPELRRKYDAGQNVDDEVGGKNVKPMKYKIIEIDRERGIAKVWWFDPNTGEEGFMEIEIDKEDGASMKNTGRSLRDHCCLPAPNTEAE